jgi:hypothetical protein
MDQTKGREMLSRSNSDDLAALDVVCDELQDTTQFDLGTKKG